jgi:predicted aldo/keto reductase-like oxidoreductase
MRRIDECLKRLNTDHVDLLHMHSLTDENDLAAIEAQDGVLKAIQKAKDQKMTRFIGVTSHTDPRVLAKLLDRHELDCTQMALNAAKAGMAKGVSGLGESHPYSFEATALPVAKRKNMGVTAMKIFAQEGLTGKAPIEKLISYALSLPVAAAVLGMPKLEYIDENIAVAKAFKPMPANEMRQLSGELAGEHKARLDEFFSHHIDA